MQWSLLNQVEFKFKIKKSPPSWSLGWPKLVKGTCSQCGKEGEDFQVVECPLWCGECKESFGKKLLGLTDDI